MVNMNASKKARYVASITNLPSGGGNSKAGFPYQVGRISWSSDALNFCNPSVASHPSCSLSQLMKTLNPNVCNSRPVGRDIAQSYWHCPGVGR